jgi:hypothetical protein
MSSSTTFLSSEIATKGTHILAGTTPDRVDPVNAGYSDVLLLGIVQLKVICFSGDIVIARPLDAGREPPDCNLAVVSPRTRLVDSILTCVSCRFSYDKKSG